MAQDKLLKNLYESQSKSKPKTSSVVSVLRRISVHYLVHCVHVLHILHSTYLASPYPVFAVFDCRRTCQALTASALTPISYPHVWICTPTILCSLHACCSNWYTISTFSYANTLLGFPLCFILFF